MKNTIQTMINRSILISLFLSLFFHSLSFGEKTTESLKEEVQSINFLEAILSATIIVQIAFVILLVMSIISWALIFQKYRLFKSIKKENKKWENIFLEMDSFESISKLFQSQQSNPLAHIFNSGYNELQKIFHQSSKKDDVIKEDRVPINNLDNVERALDKGIRNELSQLEHGLIFLATTGNSCPFIGLFGTVFGIMDSFSKIAIMGSASLSVVAPGISEALIATGLGLFAAIPASIFYNNFVNELKQIELKFSNFSTDFLNISKRNFFQNSQNQK